MQAQPLRLEMRKDGLFFQVYIISTSKISEAWRTLSFCKRLRIKHLGRVAYFEGEDNSEDQRAHHGNCSHGFGIFPQDITEAWVQRKVNTPLKISQSRTPCVEKSILSWKRPGPLKTRLLPKQPCYGKESRGFGRCLRIFRCTGQTPGKN